MKASEQPSPGRSQVGTSLTLKKGLILEPSIFSSPKVEILETVPGGNWDHCP
jgi:hypothetical protein